MPGITHKSTVAIATGEPRYPPPPFSPPAEYPEYPFGGAEELTEPNPAYHAVREALRLLSLDAKRFGGRGWNPLEGIARPGDTVVLKPNLVREFRESSRDHADCLIASGAVIRAVADYAWLAMRGRGRLIIADAPHNDADFEALRRIAGLDEIQRFYRRHGCNLEVYDLRSERAQKIDGVIVGHEPLCGDPAGYVRVNLGLHSHFAEINELCHLLYGSEYEMAELHEHQHGDVHEYLISGTVLAADTVISIPKLKTHKKVGLTVNLKNLVGINGNKNWLPHHREGTPSQGGDQFQDDRFGNRLERVTVAQFKRLFPMLGSLRPLIGGPVKALGKRVFGDTNAGRVRSGNWYGNDTAWRMCLDLNRILLYADAAGRLRSEPARSFFSVVDGLIAGEGNGPLDPSPKLAGVVLAGFNPVAVDLTCARLMGFDPARIPLLTRALEEHVWPLTAFTADEVCVRSDRAEFNRRLAEFEGKGLGFQPHFGWRGQVEWRETPAAVDAI